MRFHYLACAVGLPERSKFRVESTTSLPRAAWSVFSTDTSISLLRCRMEPSVRKALKPKRLSPNRSRFGFSRSIVRSSGFVHGKAASGRDSTSQMMLVFRRGFLEKCRQPSNSRLVFQLLRMLGGLLLNSALDGRSGTTPPAGMIKMKACIEMFQYY